MDNACLESGVRLMWARIGKSMLSVRTDMHASATGDWIRQPRPIFLMKRSTIFIFGFPRSEWVANTTRCRLDSSYTSGSMTKISPTPR
jgi:hypothetical protein